MFIHIHDFYIQLFVHVISMRTMVTLYNSLLYRWEERWLSTRNALLQLQAQLWTVCKAGESNS